MAHGLPSQDEVQFPLLRAIYQRGGSIVVSSHRDDITSELADIFDLTEEQRQLTNSENRNLW